MTSPDTAEFPAYDFYTHFYDALPHSRAYSEFCRQLYGLDLGQHGFAGMAQVEALLDAVQLKAGEKALDIGCGDGRLAEYISDRTGASVTGLDLIPAAIASGLERTQLKRGPPVVRAPATSARWLASSSQRASTSSSRSTHSTSPTSPIRFGR